MADPGGRPSPGWHPGRVARLEREPGGKAAIPRGWARRWARWAIAARPRGAHGGVEALPVARDRGPGIPGPRRIIVAITFHRSHNVGPSRRTLSRRGVGPSVGAGPLPFGLSATGRPTVSVRILQGLFWRHR